MICSQFPASCLTICQNKFVKPTSKMSSTLFTKLCSELHGNARITRIATRTKTEQCAIVQKKGKSKGKGGDEKCPNKTCGEPKKKKSFWGFLGGAKEPEEQPTRESCRRLLAKEGCQPDPDLSEFGGTAYRTCGPAYLVQKDVVEIPPDPSRQPEDQVVAKLERHPSLKDVEDPMPPFESVEQRLIKLCELGLHPAYKRYLSMPKPQPDMTLPKHPYKCHSGPIADDEYPEHLKLSKECLDRKNIYAEFKRAEPPRQMLAKMLEIRKNQRPTLERKGPAQKGVEKPAVVVEKRKKEC